MLPPLRLVVTLASSPVSRVLFPRSRAMIICLEPQLPEASSNLPGGGAGHSIASLFGLAPGGVYLAGQSPGRWCALTAPFHPCPALTATQCRYRPRLSGADGQSVAAPVPRPGECEAVYISVALALGSPPLGVTQHPALWSPDFPHAPPFGFWRARLSRLLALHKGRLIIAPSP